MTDPRTLVATEPDAPYLAVDVLPDNVPGTFLVDVSEVDGLDLLGWGMDGWLNIVCDVDLVDSSRGATRDDHTASGFPGFAVLDHFPLGYTRGPRPLRAQPSIDGVLGGGWAGERAGAI